MNRYAVIATILVTTTIAGAAGKPLVVAPSPSKPALVTLDLGKGVRLEMVLGAAGEFMMGSQEGQDGYGGDHESDAEGMESPRHRVKLSRPFYLGRFEVTVRQYRRFVEATGHKTSAERGGIGDHGPGSFDTDIDSFVEGAFWRDPKRFRQTEDHPVVAMTYEDAEAFCRWARKQTGVALRLPTEAEWEYACRAGSTTPYWWGRPRDLDGHTENVADKRCGVDFDGWRLLEIDDGYKFTAPVGSYRPNAFGLYDMAGNAAEMVSDWYVRYGSGAEHDPTMKGAGHVRRGGSFASGPGACRSAERSCVRGPALDQGFRIAVSAVEGKPQQASTAAAHVRSK